MMRRFILLSVAVLAASSQVFAADEPAGSKAIEPAEIKLDRKVSFEKDIRDIMDLNCLACHYEGGAEARLVLEDAASMIKGGKRGAGIVPGKPDESLIYLVASRQKQPHMPPLPNKVEASALTPKELGLLRQWIIEGAEADGSDAGAVVHWQPIPVGMKATYAVAMAPWGDRVAASRANKLSVYNLNSGDEAKLLDPNLAALTFDDQPMYPGGAAHRDFVHSLAFHPNGRLIASGGFRVVKLWEQPQSVQTLKAGLGGVAADVDVNAEKQLAVFGTQQNGVSLRSLADGSEVKKFDGHTAAVKGVALTADAAQVVSGSADKSIRIWSVETGVTTRQIDTPAAVNGLCLSLDGTQIIAAHEDNVIRVWSFAAPAEKKEGEAEAPVLEIKGHGGPVTSVALIRPAGQQIISGSADSTARVWNLANGSAVRSLNHGGPVVSVASRPDGAFFASASSNNVAKLWNAGSGAQVAELRGNLSAQRGEATAKEEADLAKQLVALADAGQKAAEKNATERADALKKAGEAREKADKAVEDQKKKYDEQKAKTDEAQKKFDEAKKAAEEAQAKADEAKKASDAKTDDADLKKASDEAAAEAKKLADALKAPEDELKKQNDELKKQDDELKKQEEAQKSAVRSLELATTADEKAKVEVEASKKKHTDAQEFQKTQDEASARSSETVKAAEKPLTSVAFSSDNLRLATGCEDGSITIWSAENGKALDMLSGDGGPVRTLAFSNERLLVSAGDDQNAVVWNSNPDWQLVAQLGAKNDDPLDTSASPFVFRVLSLAFSPDGNLLATGGGDPSRSGELLIWDVAKRELVREIADAHSDTVFGLEFSRDGKQIVSGSADKFVKIHNVATGEHVKSFEGHTHHVMDVSWKADGSELVSAGADNAIKVWNVETGEQIRTIANYAKQVTAIQFVGVSGNTISCGGDKTVRFHTAANGSNFRNFGGGTDFMYAADASRDQSIVVAGGEDGVIRVWNGTNAAVIKNIDPPAAADSTQASVTK